MFERKPPDMLMEKQEVDYVSRAQDVLTSGRKVRMLSSLVGSYLAIRLLAKKKKLPP